MWLIARSRAIRRRWSESFSRLSKVDRDIARDNRSREIIMWESDILCSSGAPHINRVWLTVIRYFREEGEINGGDIYYLNDNYVTNKAFHSGHRVEKPLAGVLVLSEVTLVNLAALLRPLWRSSPTCYESKTTECASRSWNPRLPSYPLRTKPDQTFWSSYVFESQDEIQGHWEVRKYTKYNLRKISRDETILNIILHKIKYYFT